MRGSHQGCDLIIVSLIPPMISPFRASCDTIITPKTITSRAAAALRLASLDKIIYAREARRILQPAGIIVTIYSSNFHKDGTKMAYHLEEVKSLIKDAIFF